MSMLTADSDISMLSLMIKEDHKEIEANMKFFQAANW